jgi:hypothetical protein
LLKEKEKENQGRSYVDRSHLLSIKDTLPGQGLQPDKTYTGYKMFSLAFSGTPSCLHLWQGEDMEKGTQAKEHNVMRANCFVTPFVV